MHEWRGLMSGRCTEGVQYAQTSAASACIRRIQYKTYTSFEIGPLYKAIQKQSERACVDFGTEPTHSLSALADVRPQHECSARVACSYWLDAQSSELLLARAT